VSRAFPTSLVLQIEVGLAGYGCAGRTRHSRISNARRSGARVRGHDVAKSNNCAGCEPGRRSHLLSASTATSVPVSPEVWNASMMLRSAL